MTALSDQLFALGFSAGALEDHAAALEQQVTDLTSPLPYRMPTIPTTGKRVYAVYDANYIDANVAGEITRARAAGITGFVVDAYDFGGLAARFKRLVDAAPAGFDIVPFADMSGSPATPETVASQIRSVSRSTVLWAWEPNSTGPQFWQRVVSAGNFDKIVMVFNSVPQDLGPWMWADALVSWGARYYDAGAPAAYATEAGRLRAAGKPYYQPVSLQFCVNTAYRPGQQMYWEAGNTETLRGTWGSAIQTNADLAFIPTWNDLAEGTQIRDQLWLDIIGYYAARYVTGKWPTIIKNGMYVTFRGQRVGGFQPVGPVPGRDKLEALCFEMADGTAVTLSTGAAAYLDPGSPRTSVRLFDLPAGKFAARLQGPAIDETVYGNVPGNVGTDMLYRVISSTRPVDL